MVALRCQVVLNPDAQGEDHIVNTWWCTRVGETDVDVAAAAFKADLDDFYQVIDGLMSPETDGWVPTFTAWDLADPKPRQPIYEANLTALDSPQPNRLPRELSICVSFRGTYVSGQNPARRRGRIYLGPWSSGMVDGATGKVAAANLATIVGAADDLLTASLGSTAYRWIVYSPTTDTAGSGSVGVYDVTAGWVDNEFDIQRRRGDVAPTARSAF